MGAQGTRKNRRRDLVLDAGALIAYERGDRRVAALIKKGVLLARLIVPASVVAEVWRGGPTAARLAHIFNASEIDPLDEGRAKEVGVRLGTRDAQNVTDAHVVCCALGHDAKVVTSDPDDMEALAKPGEPLALIAV
ncbi:MAG TPA: PIN domain-containing protein [Solirubrobacterales bacterium]|nr:PIN domain-containing protein [Solirubrobacterales bacterium]